MSALLEEVTGRLRQGLPVEIARDSDGLYATAPSRPEYYELPEAAWGQGYPARLLTRHRVIAALTLSWQGFRRLTQSGRLPYVETGGVRLYRQADVLALAGQRFAPTPTTLTACRIVVGLTETYRIEHIAHRPGGDLDVIVSATPHDHRPSAYLAFRWDAGEWRPLAGRDRDLASAVHRAEHEHRFAGWDEPELAALLDTLTCQES